MKLENPKPFNYSCYVGFTLRKQNGRSWVQNDFLSTWNGAETQGRKTKVYREGRRHIGFQIVILVCAILTLGSMGGYKSAVWVLKLGM